MQIYIILSGSFAAIRIVVTIAYSAWLCYEVFAISSTIGGMPGARVSISESGVDVENGAHYEYGVKD